MEQQSWKQQREGGGYGMGESSNCHADDLDLQAVCEVEGALLMEDYLPPSDLILDGDVDRQLSHVIRSLEAEIGGVDGHQQQQQQQEMTVMMADDDDEGGYQKPERIEDALSDDLDCRYDYEFEQGVLSSLSLLLASGGHYDEAEGWCVYTNANGYEGGGVLGYYYDMVDHHQYYYCCAEGSADHMYLPLWE